MVWLSLAWLGLIFIGLARAMAEPTRAGLCEALIGTKWHFIMYTPDGIYFISDSEYQINLMKSAIKENPELL